ncbi:MAG: hypothetical protein QOG63_2920 [Thermoleophilaceae bacterium]|nr:hypothetical protein [Thermoleophilaceae bacterium]
MPPRRASHPRLLVLLTLLAVVAPLAAAPAAHAAPKQVLRRARAALRTRSGPAGAPRDVTPLLAHLSTALPRLRGRARERAEALLARPTDGGSDPQATGYVVPEATPLCSDHFCVHWVASSGDAPDLTDGNGNGVPDWVETVDQVAEASYAVENVDLGWRTPKSDGTRGGSGVTDIYLADLAGRVYGYTAIDPGQSISRTDHSTYSYLVVDNNFAPAEFPGYDSPLTPLDVTVAHEYNHVLQVSYDAVQAAWLREATAVWMEGRVFPAVRDYLQYLPGWVRLTTQPLTRFNGQNPNDRTNVKAYGSAVFIKWLDARYGPEVARATWIDSVAAGSFSPAALDAAIRARGGAGFSDEFDRFAAATAEWQAPNSGFPEGAGYPDVRREGELPFGSPRGIHLDNTSYALADVPLGGAARVKLAVRVPRGVRSALALVGRDGSGATVALKHLSHGGDGTVVLPTAGLSRLTAVLVNSDASPLGVTRTGTWIFRHDNEPFYADASDDFGRPRVSGRSPGPGGGIARGKRIKVSFSEPVLGVSRRSFRLIAPGGGAVRAGLTARDGSRSATLVPRARLRPGRSYRVQLTGAITDLALNPLRRAPSWRLTAR